MCTKLSLLVFGRLFDSIFFFYWYGHHRDLHSFPTRRSSDLHVHRVAALEDHGAEAAPGQHERSEEHTSELQSHSDLVCRLLLEKKKTTTSKPDKDKQKEGMKTYRRKQTLVHKSPT